MNTKEQISAEESRQLALQAKLSELQEKVNRCVIHGLSFAQEYPDDYAEVQRIEEERAESQVMLERLATLSEREAQAQNFDDLIGLLLPAGMDVISGEQMFTVVQAHTASEGWRPENTPALFRIATPDEGDSTATPWMQPVGAQDAYAAGTMVEHNGKLWESETDNNVWEPGVYGWREK